MSESLANDSSLINIQETSKKSIISKSKKKLIIIKKYFYQKFSNSPKYQKITELITIILSISTYILYYLSLGGCDGTQTECLKNSNIAYYYLLVNYCFLSAGFTSFILYLIISGRVTRLHLIHEILVFSYLFLSDTGSTLMHHGIYNIIGFTLFLIAYSLILFIIIKLEDILTKKNLMTKLIVINTIILVVIFLRYLFHESLKKECKDWDLGLNNTRIKDDKNKYPCQIFRPISCHINYFNNKQDLSRLFRLNCSSNINSNQAINSRNLLIKYINKKEFEKTKNFGFPLTNTPKFIIKPEITPEIFTRRVYDNIIDMDNNSISPEEYPEITLSFEEINNEFKKGDNLKKYMGKININITRNETLSARRKQLETKDSLFNNIIMIYTDAVSRNHFKRKMPKTCAFIEKFMKNNFENDYVKSINEINKINAKRKINNKIKRNRKVNSSSKINNSISKTKYLYNKNITNNTLNIDDFRNIVLEINNVSIIRWDLYNNSNNITYKNLNNLFNDTDNITYIYDKALFDKIIRKKMRALLRKRKRMSKMNKYNKMKLGTTNFNKNISIANYLIRRRNKNKIIKNIYRHYLSKQNKTTLINRNINILNSIRGLEIINNKNNSINSSNIPKINSTTQIPIENLYLKHAFENKYYAYQFLKYHTFTSGTKFNAMPMFYGTSVFSTHGKNIIKYFKSRGYITAQTTDMCSKEVWEPENEPLLLDFDRWDHENVAMFCDPSYMDRKSLYSIYKGVYSLLRRCFYGKDVHDYIFEYGKKFWEAYPNNKKFLRMGFNDGHESTFEVLKYLDEPMANFLQFFLKKGYLKDTAIIIISDHGNHMPGLYNLFLSEQYETERVLGNFYLIFNANISNRYLLRYFRFFNKNVMENQQSIITPYDIHNTMAHIIYGHVNNKIFSDKGKSVFQEIDNSIRSCNFFDQDDEEKGLCRCVPNSKYEKFVYYNDDK